MSNKFTSQTYLSRHYFEDSKLRDFALDEFVRCMRTGRMTAFVGSMASSRQGYPSWAGLIKLAVEVACSDATKLGLNCEAQCKLNDLAKRLENELKWNDRYDGRVVASAIGAWVDYQSGTQGAGDKINAALAVKLQENLPSGTTPNGDLILKAMRESLRIKKYVTTNYDFELEFGLIGLANPVKKQRYEQFASLVGLDGQVKQDREEPVTLTMADGNVLVSDAFQRDGLDRLIEFAVASADVDFHVLHLHGHVWQPKSMIVSYRDYDRLYRRAGASKQPFEESLSLLYSTNPILFVGLGMSETELNAALEEIVGNQPFKGIGRRFLLWNAPDVRKATRGEGGEVLSPAMSSDDIRSNFRLEKLHKLGVLTIFDDEIPAETNDFVVDFGPDHFNRAATAIEKLGNYVQSVRQKRVGEIPEWSWRTIDFNGEREKDPIQYTWHFERSLEIADIDNMRENLCDIFTKNSACLRVGTSRPGTKKGTDATAAAIVWSYDYDADVTPKFRANISRPTMFINASLRLDTDSILESLRLFLCRAAGISKFDIGESRETQFEKHELFTPQKGQKPLIIFKGLERLFAKNGVPLSAEVDGFFRSYLIAASERKKSQEICRILVFGTRRVRVYFRNLQTALEMEFAKQHSENMTKSIISLETKAEGPDGYVHWLRDELLARTQITKMEPSLAEDRAFARETFKSVFGSDKFKRAFDTQEARNTAFAVLTVMAFVGQPVEADVLFHAPRVDEALKAQSSASKLKRDILDEALVKLKNLHLVFQIKKPSVTDLYYKCNEEFHTKRFALHMSLQAEMRERYGVPLSEAALSTSFNMSLFAAQPADSVVPEPSVHDELGKLIDWFAGVYKDDSVYEPKNAYCLCADALPDDPKADDPKLRARPHVAAALRAALAIIRGFYSTTALLSLDHNERPELDQRDGALTEHADRLERLIKAFTMLGEAREKRANAMSEQAKAKETYDKATTNAAIRDTLGPAAIYKDELVWLHNERGVVKLAQGDLYEARFSLDEADRINRKYVEFNCHSHNWRRIWLNQVVVDLERGKLAEAEDRISRIENSLSKTSDVTTIRKELRDLKPGMPIQLPLHISHEDCLAISLTTGYRALIHALRGELNPGKQMFELAISMLEALDEQRAIALMRKHFASLLYVLEGDAEMIKMAKLAIAGAESCQQMDVAYGARIIRHTEHARSARAEDRLRAMQLFNRSLEFASQTDLHRVAIEARRALASLKLANGDMESALEHARIAMAIAGRYGFSLHKITLRILLGRILWARQNEAAGEALIRNAIVQAERIGFQRAVDSAQYAFQNMHRAV